MPGASFALTIDQLPAPDAIVDAVQEIEVETATEVASVFRIRLGISQTAAGQWTILDEGTFAPLTVVGIRVGTGPGIPSAILNGYVSQVRVVYGEGPGETQLEVSGMDATVLMNLTEVAKAWPNQPDSAIAAQIFGQYRLIPLVDVTTPSLIEPEGTTIQRGTDIRFLRRLAKRHGFDCFVRAEPMSGLDQGFFKRPNLIDFPQALLSVDFGTDTNVTDFSIRYDMVAPTGPILRNLDVLTKSTQQGFGFAPLVLMALGAPEILFPQAEVIPAETGLVRTTDLRALGQGITERAALAIAAEGTVGPDVGVLAVGGTVNIRGAGLKHSGPYYVTRVLHTITRDGYTQRFEAKRNTLSATPAVMPVGG